MKINSPFRFTATLLILCALSTTLVAGAFTYTKDIIAERKTSDIKQAYSEIFPNLKTLTSIKTPADSAIKDIKCSSENGTPNGYIYTASAKGYGGDVTVMVAFSYPEKNITGIKILEQRETPGLGAKCTEDDFTKQFKNKNMQNPLALSKQAKGEEIQAITAATITSRAVVTAVNEARVHFREHYANQM